MLPWDCPSDVMTTPRNTFLTMASLSALILLSNAQCCFAQKDEILTSAQIRDSVHDRLFEQGPFVANWQIEREEQPDFESFARGRERKIAKLRQANASEEFIKKHMEIFDEGKKYLLTGRKMDVTQTIGLSAHRHGCIEKNYFDADSGKNWPSLHFLTPDRILSVIEEPDDDTYVLEPDREQLFFAARGIPALWALHYLDRCVEPTVNKNGNEIHWQGKERDTTRHLIFKADTMELIRAETRRNDKPVHQLSITEGNGLFPDKCLIREYRSTGKLYATETVILRKIERVAAEEIRTVQIEADGNFWDRRTNPVKEITAAELFSPP